MQVGKLLIAPNRFPLLLIVIRIPSKNLPSSRPSQVSKRRGTKRPKELLPLPEGPTITKNSPGPTHFLAKHMKCPKNEGIHGNPPFGSYSWTSLDFEVGKDQMPSCCLETFQKILQEDTPKNLETSVSTSCLELPHKFRSLFWTCLKHAKYALDSSPQQTVYISRSFGWAGRGLKSTTRINHWINDPISPRIPFSRPQNVQQNPVIKHGNGRTWCVYGWWWCSHLNNVQCPFHGEFPITRG